MTFLRSRRRWLAIGVTLACSFWLASAAYAIPIGEHSVADLDSHTVLTSGNGQLSFTNFKFDLGCVDPDDFTLSVLDDGIRLTGPMSVSGGAATEFRFSYDVSVLGNAPGINGASLFAPSEITGGSYPTFVKTSKQIDADSTSNCFDPETLATLMTRNFDGAYSELASASFAPQQQISVLDRIRLSSGGHGDTATLDEITNRFSVVPEPATFALLGMGILGLGIAGRRRQT